RRVIELNIHLAADIVYGDHIVRKEGGHRKLVRAKSDVSRLRRGMAYCHQSALCRLELLKQASFNTRWKIAADFEQVLSLADNGARFFKIDLCISEVSAGGVSDSKRFKSISERIRILASKRKLDPSTIVFYMWE